MLFQIAWRNVWRNKIRSLVVIGSVVIGVWSILFILAFSAAMIGGYVDNAIRNETSHIQIHHPDFVEEKEIKFLLPKVEEVVNSLKNNPDIEAVATRTVVNGMLKSARGARGVNIRGVHPAPETVVTHLSNKIIEGNYFRTGREK